MRRVSYFREPPRACGVGTDMPSTQTSLLDTVRSAVHWIFNPPLDGPRATTALRLMVGGVFFWEGILKFVYANQGIGRFTKLGMPFPALTAGFIGSLEIAGGILLMLGLLTRFIAIPFLVEMVVAVLTTKVALYLGTSPLPLPAAPPQIGIWAVLHEVRSEYAQFMTCLFLLFCGPGQWSLDAQLVRKRSRSAGALAVAPATSP
jgi:uncharacterized membrane protein YphA (DoxX/SURF4 family)